MPSAFSLKVAISGDKHKQIVLNYIWPVTVSSRHYVVSYILDEAFRFRHSANYTLPFLLFFAGLSVFDLSISSRFWFLRLSEGFEKFSLWI